MIKRKEYGLLLALLLLCSLVLSGCALKNDTLDAQMGRVLDVLNRGDEEAFAALFYPDIASDSELYEIFGQFREVWTPTAIEQVTLVSYNVNSAPGKKDFRGIYELPRSDEYSHMELHYLETGEGSGLLGLQMGKLNDASTGKTSPWQTVYFVLCGIFVLLTLVDIIRKKPLKYGWLIVLAIFFFNLRINGFAFTIPLGSVIYWCLRRKLLWEKAVRMKTPVSYTPFVPNPPAHGPKEGNEDQSGRRDPHA